MNFFRLEPSNPWVNGTWPGKGHRKTGSPNSVPNPNPSHNQVGGLRGGLKCVGVRLLRDFSSGSPPRGGFGLAVSYEQTSSLLFSSPRTPYRPPCDGGILQGLDKGSANSFSPAANFFGRQRTSVHLQKNMIFLNPAEVDPGPLSPKNSILQIFPPGSIPNILK